MSALDDLLAEVEGVIGSGDSPDRGRGDDGYGGGGEGGSSDDQGALRSSYRAEDDARSMGARSTGYGGGYGGGGYGGGSRPEYGSASSSSSSSSSYGLTKYDDNHHKETESRDVSVPFSLLVAVRFVVARSHFLLLFKCF
jgi:hypothetical protein